MQLVYFNGFTFRLLDSNQGWFLSHAECIILLVSELYTLDESNERSSEKESGLRFSTLPSPIRSR